MSASNNISVSNPTQPVISVTDDGGVLITVAYQSGTGGGGSGDVTGPASSTDNAIARYDGTTGKLIQNSDITIADGASGTLSGSNSGDVTIGTANGLSLAGQALSLAAASGSTTGALTSADWTTFNSKQAAGNYITALTGDVTASGPGSAAATLANTAVTPGSYTLASLTVDAKGRITAASSGTAVTPGGSDTQVQFNDGGAFGGDADFTFDKTTNKVGLSNIQAIGSGGINLYANGAVSIGNLGPAGTSNVSWGGSHNFAVATQDTIAAFTGVGKTLGSLATATYPSLTELSYVKGVTSAIQTQLNAKQATLTLGTNVAASFANNMAASGTLAILGANTFTGVQTATGFSLTSSTNQFLAVTGTAAPQYSAVGSTTNGMRVSTDRVDFWVSGAVVFTAQSGTVGLSSNNLSWGSNVFLFGNSDGTGRLVERNGTSAQTFSIANTYTGFTNKEELELGWVGNSNIGKIRTIKGSGGGAARALYLGTDSTDRMGFEATTFNTFMLASAGSYGSGSGVLFLGNATTAPTTNPTGGGILYVEAGALKFRGSSGTVTTIANA